MKLKFSIIIYFSTLIRRGTTDASFRNLLLWPPIFFVCWSQMCKTILLIWMRDQSFSRLMRIGWGKWFEMKLEKHHIKMNFQMTESITIRLTRTKTALFFHFVDTHTHTQTRKFNRSTHLWSGLIKRKQSVNMQASRNCLEGFINDSFSVAANEKKNTQMKNDMAWCRHDVFL